MSNIYDSANELSRGYAELPEYSCVKAAKDAIQADEQASKMVTISLSNKKLGHGANGRSFPRKDAILASKLQNALLSDFFAKQQTIVHLPQTLKNRSLNLFQNC